MEKNKTICFKVIILFILFQISLSQYYSGSGYLDSGTREVFYSYYLNCGDIVRATATWSTNTDVDICLQNPSRSNVACDNSASDIL